MYDSKESQLKMPLDLPVGFPEAINNQQKQCYFTWLGRRPKVSKSLKNSIKMR